MKKDIFIILPFKESLNPNYAGAVSLYVKDTTSHSKFKNIMHRKGAQDKKRAKIFSRLGREISVAVKEGGPDPEKNIRLRSHTEILVRRKCHAIRCGFAHNAVDRGIHVKCPLRIRTNNSVYPIQSLNNKVAPFLKELCIVWQVILWSGEGLIGGPLSDC